MNNKLFHLTIVRSVLRRVLWKLLITNPDLLLLLNLNKLKKYRNNIISKFERENQKRILKSGPQSVRIPPINMCNYKCLFCEIHKDDLLFPNRVKNMISLEDIKRFEYFLSTTSALNFYGGSAEPLINKNFSDIVKYLKNKYGMSMMVNTNASVLNKRMADIFINYGFDYILTSYHAGTRDGYKWLMTGNIEKVNENIQYLISRRNILKKKKPQVVFNFAIHKKNVNEFRKVIDNANVLGVDSILVSRYYGGFNKLQKYNPTYDEDVDEGNKVLDDIYIYAKKRNVKLTPVKPLYWQKKPNEVVWEPDNYDKKKKCVSPWTNLQFNPVLDDKSCFYVGVCNRIILFKLNYEKVSLLTAKDSRKLWNHPVLQYMRETVNAENINPICKYCKNYDREMLRNLDEIRYGKIRDDTVKEFFLVFREKYEYSNIDGLEVLTDNPLDNEKNKEVLKTFYEK